MDYPTQVFFGPKRKIKRGYNCLSYCPRKKIYQIFHISSSWQKKKQWATAQAPAPWHAPLAISATRSHGPSRIFHGKLNVKFLRGTEHTTAFLLTTKSSSYFAPKSPYLLFDSPPLCSLFLRLFLLPLSLSL